MIIGFAGKKRSGKDTIANFLVENYGFKRFAFGDAVKEVSRHLFGLNEEQLYGDNKEEIVEELGISPREIFQKLGTEFGRNYLHELFPSLRVSRGTIWTYHFENFVKNNKNTNIVISDVRFENEMEVIRKCGGKIYFIESDYAKKEDNHISEEISKEKYLYDGIIDNKGTLEEFYKNGSKLFDLYHKAENFRK
jgi:dephospho-CoA kinase